MEKKTDARVIKTRRLIEATFLELLQDIPFEKLTTTRLIEECLISKGTFYAHFLDKYDLAEQLLDRELELFENLLIKRLETKKNTPEEIALIISQAFDFSEHLTVFETLQLPNRKAFYLELQEVYQKVYRTYLSGHGYQGNLDLQALLFSAVAMSYVTYVRTGNPVLSAQGVREELLAFWENMEQHLVRDNRQK